MVTGITMSWHSLHQSTGVISRHIFRPT